MLTDRPFGSLIREDKPTKDLWGILDRHAKPITFDAIRIKLASPVSHVWFFKGLPSRIGQLLDMSLRELEKILYFEEYVVLESSIETVGKVAGIKKKDLISVDKVRKLQEEHGPSALKVGMGAEAIRELLRDMDLDSLARDLRAQMLGETSVQKRKKIVKRLKVIEAFLKSGNQPD